MPTLVDTWTSSVPSWNGPSSAVTIFCAMSPTWVAGVSSVRIRQNSSPPKRATTSDARTTDLMRRATSISSWSPLAWPRLSLTSLKWSRSSSSKAMPSPLRCACLLACCQRSSRMRRFGRPVSASKLACSQIKASLCLRAPTSCIALTSRQASSRPSLRPCTIQSRWRRSSQRPSPRGSRQSPDCGCSDTRSLASCGPAAASSGPSSVSCAAPLRGRSSARARPNRAAKRALHHSAVPVMSSSNKPSGQLSKAASRPAAACASALVTG